MKKQTLSILLALVLLLSISIFGSGITPEHIHIPRICTGIKRG